VVNRYADGTTMTGFRLLLILFLTVPMMEIYVLIKVGSLLGALPTVFLVVLTAILGALLLRWQGFSTLQRVNSAVARGEIPAIELLEGAVLLVSGVLLLTPGFITDIAGFLGLVTPVRRRLVTWFLAHQGMIMGAGGRGRRPPQHHGPRTIEGEFWRDKDPHR
jgi:UPF0716 protein FxsA